MNESDLRVIKTRQNIRFSFIKLLQQKDFYKITIKDLLDEALINRTTFYKHYSDKYQLSEELCNEAFNSFTDCIEQRFISSSADDIQNAIKTLYITLADHSQDILALFKIHTETIHLYDDMFHYLKERLQKEHTYDSDYLPTLYASLVMTTITWCLEHEDYKKLENLLPNFYQIAKLFQI